MTRQYKNNTSKTTQYSARAKQAGITQFKTSTKWVSKYNYNTRQDKKTTRQDKTRQDKTGHTTRQYKAKQYKTMQDKTNQGNIIQGHDNIKTRQDSTIQDNTRQ